MNNRERFNAIMHYEKYDRMPLVHFGFWIETLQKWVQEGILKPEEIKNIRDGSPAEKAICDKLGFDFGYYNPIASNTGFIPGFPYKVIETLADGSKKIQNGDGVIVLQAPDAGSIPAEIEHLLKDRKSWEEHYLPKLQYQKNRVNYENLERLKKETADCPCMAYAGSLMGNIRNWIGVEGLSYLWMDDPDLFAEIIQVNADLSYKCLEDMLASGVKFDCGHYWEDICFKNGPLLIPNVYDELCGPQYKRFSALYKKYGIDIISLDCDGLIDSLIPTWLNNGVNTMFPIEVGTWNASIGPWREKYGREIRGVGGMNKVVFSRDFKAIDEEIERLKALVEMGGYIPCPDHRIPPDAKWDNVRYYCDKFRKTF